MKSLKLEETKGLISKKMKDDELGVVNKSAENFLQNLFTKLSSFSHLQEDNR